MWGSCPSIAMPATIGGREKPLKPNRAKELHERTSGHLFQTRMLVERETDVKCVPAHRAVEAVGTLEALVKGEDLFRLG